jgi:hypothetical protein
MKKTNRHLKEIRLAKATWGDISRPLVDHLLEILETFELSLAGGFPLDSRSALSYWYFL